MAPRVLFRMIREYHDIERERMKLSAYLARGGTLAGDEDQTVAVDVHPDAF